MMTDTPGPPVSADSGTLVPWRKLSREVAHRTSWPTDEAVRVAIAKVGGGRLQTTADIVLLAALRRVTDDDLRAEVRLIREEMFTPDPPEH